MKATLDDASFGQHDECSALFMDAQDGDGDAAAKLYRKCVPELRRWLAGQVAGCDAEEVAHTAMVAAFRKARRFQRGGSFQAWLKTIARHLALNQQRDESRRRRRESAWCENERVLADGTTSDDDMQRMRVLSRCLATLPEPQRRLLNLRYAKGISASAIATMTGRKRSAVAVSLHRLCRQLRTEMQETQAHEVQNLMP